MYTNYHRLTIPDTKSDYGIKGLQYKSVWVDSPNVILFEVWGIRKKKERGLDLSIIRNDNYFSLGSIVAGLLDQGGRSSAVGRVSGL